MKTTTKLYRLHSFKKNQLFTVAIVAIVPALGQVLKSLYIIIVRFFSEFVKEDKYLKLVSVTKP